MTKDNDKPEEAQFEERTGELIKFETDNQTYVGKLNRITLINVQGKPVYRMHVTGVDGKQGLILQTTQMESNITEDDCGKYIRLTRVKMVASSGGRSMMEFKIEVSR